MNEPDINEFKIKTGRIRKYMSEKGYGAVILSLRQNLSWLTSGGDFKVLRNTDGAAASVLITESRVFLIAEYMDIDRISDDEIAGLDMEKVTLHWYEESAVERAKLTAGNVRIAADTDTEGTDYRLWDIYGLHYPLTDNEKAKYRKAASVCDEILLDVANRVMPGMSEIRIEAEIAYEYAKKNMVPKVLLVGSDGRIERYRHPNASEKKLEKFLLIHPAADCCGLHLNITRMVYFGDRLPPEIEEKYELLNQLLARAAVLSKSGGRFTELLDDRKKVLSKTKWPDDWKNHYPGALSGYFLGNSEPFFGDMVFCNRMPMDYFITLPGAKVEEMCLCGDDGGEFISCGYSWPVREYRAGGKTFRLPQILLR